jgi:hypothetical protein
MNSVRTVAWWLRLLLVALAAAVAVLLGAGTASAATLPVLETRVGASAPTGARVVGVHESVSAGQQWGNAPPQGETIVATGVAAEGAPRALPPGKPQWVINAESGALAEAQGYARALDRGHIGLRGPTKVNENGPDFITFDPRLGRIQVADAKFSKNGVWPSGIPLSTQERWMPTVRSAVAEYSGPLASQVRNALVNGDIDWVIYTAP